MPLPLLTRYADTLRYDAERGAVLALDWRAYPQAIAFVECADVEAVAGALESAAVGIWGARYLAAYGLVLAARAWAGRPSDARRGAIIQAGERLRGLRPGDYRLVRIVEQGLVRADAAILAGADAEQSLLSFIGGEVSRADRVAERCGRIAAGLLDEGDHVLTHGFAGPALNWMLHVALTEQEKQLTLAVGAGHPDHNDARLTAALAREIGVPVELLDDPALERDLARAALTVLIVGAEQIALDGGILGASGVTAYAELARRHGVPRYILGYDGPNPAAPAAADLTLGVEVTPPDLISAIITNRGIYRPEMIARYLGDGDAPLDVIPLSPNI
jgi:methylthioribose-1-phosphate isomerase